VAIIYIDKVKKKTFIYFILKTFFLLLIVIIFDFSFGSILHYYYFKQKSGLQYRTTYAMEKTTADLLIFGASRANHHYHPEIFEKQLLNYSYYNVGRDGTSIFYHYAVLKSVLKRYSPKVAILDFDCGEFMQNQDSYDRLSSLFPYYKNHTEIRSIIELKSPYEKFKLLSNIYPYNSSILTIAVGNQDFNKKRKLDFKGYVPLTKMWNGSIQIDNTSIKYKIDSTKVKVYALFIQDCMNSKVKLYVVCSPSLIKSKNTDYSIIIGQEIAKKNNIDFFDYSKDSIFLNNSSLFQDINHLNDEGAKKFSKILIDKIKKVNDK
jgi:hypothetical protein